MFDQPIVSYMTRDPEVAHLDTPIESIARTMHSRDISGMPVVDGKGTLVGVVTRTDLIKLGLVYGGARAMPLPHRRASDVMSLRPLQTTSEASLKRAARLMIDHDVHRVFVTEGGQLCGVISAIDLTAAVRDAKLAIEVSTIMTQPILTIEVDQPLGRAIELLDRVHVTGLIVTEGGQPIGMFTQLDALASRDLPRSTPVETVYDVAVICVPSQMKLYRAAAHAAQLQIRRLVVCKQREAIGVVSASDFARVVARA